jgi:heme A synthase
VLGLRCRLSTNTEGLVRIVLPLVLFIWFSVSVSYILCSKFSGSFHDQVICISTNRRLVFVPIRSQQSSWHRTFPGGEQTKKALGLLFYMACYIQNEHIIHSYSLFITLLILRHLDINTHLLWNYMVTPAFLILQMSTGSLMRNMWDLCE